MEKVHKPQDFKLLGKSNVEFPSSPDKDFIDTFPNHFADRNFVIEFDCSDFTSLCPITSQPDYAEIKIRYIPKDKCIETKSLKYYLQAFRGLQAFNEEIVNRILDDLVEVCTPEWMSVKGAFATRGGISLSAISEYPVVNPEILTNQNRF